MRDISINVSEMTPFLRFEYVLLLRAFSDHPTKVLHLNGIYKNNFCISAGVFQLKYSVFPNKNTYQRIKKNINKLLRRDLHMGEYCEQIWQNLVDFFYGGVW